MIKLEKYKHIIWDWNGTLINDTQLVVAVLNETLAARNREPVTVEQYRSQVVFPVKDFYTRIGFDFSKESYEDVAREYIRIYNAKRFECALHDGVADVLKEIHKQNIPQSILSAYEQQMLGEAVSYYKIEAYFQHLSGPTDFYAHGKIAVGKELMKTVDADPQQVLLIGDTTHDVEVADALHIDCLLFSGGHYSLERLQECNKPIVYKWSEFLTHMNN